MANSSVVEKRDVAAAATSNVDELALNDTGFCNLCGETADNKCDRCGDFYCSQFCQRRDWHNHRYICFPMPNLVKTRRNASSKNDIASKEESQPQIVANAVDVPQTNNLPPHGSCVLLVGFKSSNRCYIRSTNPSCMTECQKVLNEIHEFGKKSSAFSEIPKVNAFALALREDKWCRVQVLGGRKDNYYRIRFMDFGEISKRYLKDLRRVSRAVINLPCFSNVVQLNDIVNFSSDSKLLESLKKYTNMEYRVEYVQPDAGGGNVKLYNWQNNTLLNSLILDLMSQNNDKDMERASTISSFSNSNEVHHNGSEKPVMNGISNKKECENNSPTAEKKTELVVSPSLSVVNSSAQKKIAPSPRQIQMHKPVLQPPFEIIPISEKDSNCKILIVDDSYIGSGYVGCLLDKYCENLNAVSKFLQEYKVSDQSYKPKLNEYCLAMFENDWYRAKVVEILSEDKFLVVYIDFTNEMELSSKLIRRYPMSLTLPCHTTLCALDGLPDDISEELKNFLELNYKSFTHLNIENIRSVDDICYVESKELLNKVRNAKLL